MAQTYLFQSTCEMDDNGQGSFPETVREDKRIVLKTVTGFYWGDDSSVLGCAYLTIAGCRYAFPWVQCGGSDSRAYYGFNHYVTL
jgi:hypothetical protein